MLHSRLHRSWSSPKEISSRCAQGACCLRRDCNWAWLEEHLLGSVRHSHQLSWKPSSACKKETRFKMISADFPPPFYLFKLECLQCSQGRGRAVKQPACKQQSQQQCLSCWVVNGVCGAATFLSTFTSFVDQ